MTNLKPVILRLLNGEEVIVVDDRNYYELKLEKWPEGVEFAGDTTLIIHASRLKD